MTFMFRWLGTAGLELHLDGKVLLIDPFLSRPPAWKIFDPRGVFPDREIIARHISTADYILVTHSHYDHLFDVPEIMQMTGARAFGSQNSCEIIGLHGLPASTYSRIVVGDRLEVGPFAIEVFPARHTHTPLDRWINGGLPDRVKNGKLPFRLMDYRMDDCFSFRIETPGVSLLVGNHPIPADILFISPYYSLAALKRVLGPVSPRLVVPFHWDDFTRPLTARMRPMVVTSRQGWQGWPPVRVLDLVEFGKRIQKIQPDIKLLNPVALQMEIYEPG